MGRSAMAAGFTIGVVDDVGARVDAQQPRPLAEKAAERLRQKRAAERLRQKRLKKEALGRKGLQKERR